MHELSLDNSEQAEDEYEVCSSTCMRKEVRGTWLRVDYLLVANMPLPVNNSSSSSSRGGGKRVGRTSVTTTPATALGAGEKEKLERKRAQQVALSARRR